MRIAQSLSDQAQYDSAIYYYLASKEVFKSLNLQENVLDAQNNAGLLHIALNRLEIGRKYLDSVISAAEKSHPEFINQHALAYNYLGNFYNRKADYDSTVFAYFSALNLQNKSPDSDPFDVVMTYNNIGSVYNDRGDYFNAVVYLDSALKLVEAKMDPETLIAGIVCNNMGFS